MPATHDLSAAPAPSTPAPADPDRPEGMGLLVGVVLSGIVVATLLMVGFIWYRWHDVREPTTAIIIAGDASLDGTKITVTGNTNDGPRVIPTELNKQNGYVAPILVEPGTYIVTAERNGMRLLSKDVQVWRFLGIRYPLDEYVREAVARGILPPQVLDPAPATPSSPGAAAPPPGTGTP